MYAAIENVSDRMARKMRKVKEKAIMKGKWEGRAGPRGTPHSTSAVRPCLRIHLETIIVRGWWVDEEGGRSVSFSPSNDEGENPCPWQLFIQCRCPVLSSA